MFVGRTHPEQVRELGSPRRRAASRNVMVMADGNFSEWPAELGHSLRVHRATTLM